MLLVGDGGCDRREWWWSWCWDSADRQYEIFLLFILTLQLQYKWGIMQSYVDDTAQLDCVVFIWNELKNFSIKLNSTSDLRDTPIRLFVLWLNRHIMLSDTPILIETIAQLFQYYLYTFLRHVSRWLASVLCCQASWRTIAGKATISLPSICISIERWAQFALWLGFNNQLLCHGWAVIIVISE